jgi:uncharacterized protein (TIGR02145 family)
MLFGMNRKYYFLITLLCTVSAISFYANGQETSAFTDARDGRVYKTVTIGEQTWMGENLAFKTQSGYSVYDGVNDYAKTHGYLYTWEAATKACPDGWHLPSMQEWWNLSNFLGGDEVSGGKLKHAGTTSWKSPNAGATNSSGFTALPSGRSGDKAMEYFGNATYFWTNVDDDDVTSWCGELKTSGENLSLYPVEKKNGFSVRCIKNSGKAEKVFDFW